MMITPKPALDQFLRVLQETETKYSHNGAWISVLNTIDYRINIANTAYVNRIDLIGFNPPDLPSIIYLDANYGRTMAQIHMSAPNHYIIELFRVLVLHLKKLPKRMNWERKSAPQMVLDSNVAYMLKSIYTSETNIAAFKKEKQNLASIFRPKKIDAPMREYIASEDEVDVLDKTHSHKSNIELPLLPFDDGDDWNDRTTPTGTIPDIKNEMSFAPTTVAGKKGSKE